MSLAYQGYWQRKQLLSGTVPHFPVCRWWDSNELCEIERIYFQEVLGATSLLDVGAGDLRVMRKLQKAGYQGEYHTQDISDEHPYTHRTLCEINRTYGAILCLDVLEHLALEEGLKLIDTLVGMLQENGVLILQTPNARCANNPLAWDMTHLHLYNIHDLWAYLSTSGLHVHGYRVVFDVRPKSPLERIRSMIARVTTTQCLGMDYAHNIALIARRQAGAREPLQ
jgi:methyltransferase family protein